MKQLANPRVEQRLFIFGLILLFFILLINPWTVPLVLARRPLVLQDFIRIWFLDGFFLLLGLTLIAIKYRHKFSTRLFDILVGLLITLLTLLAIETGFYWLNSLQSSSISETMSAPFYNPSPLVGFENKPNLVVQSSLFYEDDPIFEVTYTTDEFGRRLTSATQQKTEKFIAFIGGSFTFGAGVEDDETLSAQVARRAPEYAIYNYGVNGYGTSHILANIERGKLANEITEDHGILIYTFIDPHVARTIGTLSVHNSRGGITPYYNDELERQGTLVTGRPALSLIYGLIGASQTAHYFGFDFPKITDDHYQFTARMIKKAEQVFKQQFPASEFYVLLYPGQGKRLIPFLKEEQINYLDYGHWPEEEEGLRIPHDGHPTPKANRLLAEYLVDVLRLTSP